ncbi:hypothetical protein BC829DRAFT_390578 [Chytridium lagenaria]|nr:hypothetical protein BC829DRAFT_390578 [Chytridium lagenaria]
MDQFRHQSKVMRQEQEEGFEKDRRVLSDVLGMAPRDVGWHTKHDQDELKGPDQDEFKRQKRNAVDKRQFVGRWDGGVGHRHLHIPQAPPIPGAFYRRDQSKTPRPTFPPTSTASISDYDEAAAGGAAMLPTHANQHHPQPPTNTISQEPSQPSSLDPSLTSLLNRYKIALQNHGPALTRRMQIARFGIELREMSLAVMHLYCEFGEELGRV